MFIALSAWDSAQCVALAHSAFRVEYLAGSGADTGADVLVMTD